MSLEVGVQQEYSTWSSRMEMLLVVGPGVRVSAVVHSKAVGGSYSARVPRSSLAGVHREFVHHIVEDESDGQEERQDDKRADGQQREESGEVEESQNTQHERMEMTHGM